MSESENKNIKAPVGYINALPFHPPMTAAQERDIGWIRQQVADLLEVIPRMQVAPTITRRLGPGPREGLEVEVQNGGRDMARALTYLRAFHATAELAIAGGPPMPEAKVECKMTWDEADAQNAQGVGVTPTVGASADSVRMVVFQLAAPAKMSQLASNGDPLPQFGTLECSDPCVPLAFLEEGGILKFEPTSEKGVFISEKTEDAQKDILSYTMPSEIPDAAEVAIFGV